MSQSEKIQDLFKVASFKYLSQVDCPKRNSHQHEIGGLVKTGFGQHLGIVSGNDKIKFTAWFVRLEDNAEPSDALVAKTEVSWYNARNRIASIKAKRSPEYRLYYQDNEVSNTFCPGDFFLIALTVKDELLILSAPHESQSEVQLRALFNISNESNGTAFVPIDLGKGSRNLPLTMLLSEATGLSLFYLPQNSDSGLLEQIIRKFPNQFPATKEFSAFIESLFPADPVSDPDASIELWMREEDRAFHLLEKHFVQQRIDQGFRNVEDFTSCALSVLNRRKSRAGHAFENHLEKVFRKSGLRFTSQGRTEQNKRPDFLFPGEKEYQNSNFPSSLLRVLGAKTTCKDRWRQVLSEADRIQRKHLVTMEIGISNTQLEEMRAQHLKLVIPSSLRATYTEAQQQRILTLSDFINEIRDIQGIQA